MKSRRTRHDRRGVRAAVYRVDVLESRRLLANRLFGHLADQLQPQLDTLDTAMQTVSSVANVLPLINKSANDLQEISNTFGQFKTQLLGTLRALDDPANAGSTAVVSAIQHAVFTAMGPPGLDLLTDVTGDGLNEQDVVITNLTDSSVRIRFDLGKTFSLTPDFGLGISAVPFKPLSAQQALLALTMSLKNFSFGYSNGSFDFLNGGAAQLKFDLVGNLPANMGSGVLGFLNFGLTDLTPGTATPDLNLTLTADVSSANGISNIRYSGNAAIHLGLTVTPTFTKYLPKVDGQLWLDWSFSNVDATGARSSFGAPTLSLKNMRINVRGILDSLTGPLAGYVADVLRPIAPILKVLDTPIPGLSDIMEAVGFDPVTLLSIAGLGAPGDVIDAIQTADKLLSTLQTINNFVAGGTADNAWINLGDVSLGALAGGATGSSANLLSEPPATVGAPTGDWTHLVNLSAATGLAVSVQNQINALFGGAASTVNDVLFHTGTAGGVTTGNGVDAAFPVVEDPRGAVFKMLTGQDTDLVTITAKISNLNLSNIPVFEFPIVPPLFGKIELHVTASLYAKLGIDTRGIRLAATDIVNGVPVVTALAKLPQGFYLDPNTGAKLTGSIDLLGTLDLGLVSFSAGGSIGLSFNTKLVTTGPDLDGNPSKLRPIASIAGGTLVPGEVSPGHLLNLTGSVDVGLSFEVEIGISPFSVTFGVNPSFTLFTFANTDVDPIFDPAPVLGSVDSGTLNLNIGPRANLRQAASGDIDERLIVRQTGADSVVVTGWGQSQTFSGVTRIVGDGGTGNDNFNVYSTSIPVSLNGGDGTDVMDITAPSATLNGGNGDDYLSLHTGLGISSLLGGSGNDNLNAYLLANGATVTLDGGDDNDNLSINAYAFAVGAASAIIGGSGDDTANVTFPGGLPPIDLGAGGNDALRVTAGGTTARNFVFDNSGLTISGTAIPTSNAEFVSATAGSGNDTATFNNPSTNVQFNGGPGNDTGTSMAGNVGVNFYGGDGNDSFTAFASQGSLNVFGGAGNDTVALGDGAIVLPGGNIGAPSNYLKVRNLHLDAGTGSDKFIVDDSTDAAGHTIAVDYSQDTSVTPRNDIGAITIDGLGTSFGNYTYGGVETVDVRLGSGNDTANFTIDAGAPTLNALLLNAGGGADVLNLVLNVANFGITSVLNLGAGADTATISGNSLAASGGKITIDGGNGQDALTVAGQLGPALSFLNTGEVSPGPGSLLDTLTVTAARAANAIVYSTGVGSSYSDIGYGDVILDHSAADPSDVFNYDSGRVIAGNLRGEWQVTAYTGTGVAQTSRVVIRAVGSDINQPLNANAYHTRVIGNEAGNEFHSHHTDPADRVAWEGRGGDDHFFLDNWSDGSYDDDLHGYFTLLGGTGNDRMDYDAHLNIAVDYYFLQNKFVPYTPTYDENPVGTIYWPADDIEAKHFYPFNADYTYWLRPNGGHGLVIHAGDQDDVFHIDGQTGFSDATLLGGGGNDKVMVDPTDSGFVAPDAGTTVDWTVNESTLARHAPAGVALASGSYTLDGFSTILIDDQNYAGLSTANVSNTSPSTFIQFGLGYYGRPAKYAVTVGRSGMALRDATIGRILLLGIPIYPDNYTLILDDTADTTGATGFIDGDWIGARPGDMLAGNARYGIEARGFKSGVLNLGPGSDTIYLTQRATSGYVNTQWTINGGAQAAGGSDRLIIGMQGNVATAGSGAMPNGFVNTDAGSTLGNIAYTGIESVTQDNSVAKILSSTFDRDGVRPALVLHMNSVDLQPLAFFDVDGFEGQRRAKFTVNNSLAYYDQFYNVQSTVDNATHTVRIEYIGPDSPSGAFPDGNYSLLFRPFSIRTLAGNTLQLDPEVNPNAVEVDFASLAGDTNGDSKVNFTDLLTLAQNYGQSQRVYSQGDFDYDGTVNFSDLLILAQHYNASLSTVAGSMVSASASIPVAKRSDEGVAADVLE